MDLVSDLNYSTKTGNATSEKTIHNYLFRQEILAYQNQQVYHENNLPTQKNIDKVIHGNPVRDSLESPSTISSNIRSQIINDQNCRVTKAIPPGLPLDFLQHTNRRIISPERVMNDKIKTQFSNRENQGILTKTVCPIEPINDLQQSNQTYIDPEQASCSRNLRNTPVDPNSNHGLSKPLLAPAQGPRENAERQVAEKTTYCRPAVDMFICKTIQKNARLQVLVKKLALIREKEKQQIAWDNYIKSLENRHIRYRRSESRTIPDSIPEYTNFSNSEIVENVIKRPACTTSRNSQYMLEDYHSALNCGRKNLQYHLTPRLPPTYNSNGPNFTTNSRMMPNLELPRYDYQTQSLPRYDCPYQAIPRFDYPTTPPTRAQIFLNDTLQQSRSNVSRKGPTPLQFKGFNKGDMRNTSVQKNTSVVSAESEEKIKPDKSLRNIHKQERSNVEIIKKKVSEVEVNYSQLSTIDRKLDELIYSINNFIDGIKSRKNLTNMTNRREAINQTNSSSYLVCECNLKRGETRCRTMQDKAISNISLCKGPQEILYTILNEEMHKSDKAKKDIENIISKPNRSSSSLTIMSDIPTKDGSIEIKDSFKVDPRSVCVKEMAEDKRMTIAVNTDPLGLLALFRVSAEAVKQLLSFVPSIDYYSYMSMLPLPAATHKCHYVCNICGAAFDRPSQLSDHIQRHSLGRTRDCCVCRHVLDAARQSDLFTCRHCGQKFTRAYCRELHQLSCARALGKVPEDSSSHLILR